MSFIVKDETNRSVGVAINFDANDEPQVIVPLKLSPIFEFLEFLEAPVREKHLPPGKNKILHSLLMGTSPELNAQENISCMDFMQNEIVNLAINRKFTGVLSTDTSALTQQLAAEVYGFKNMSEYQTNQYTAPNGSRPFSSAPDSYKVIVNWKDITELQPN